MNHTSLHHVDTTIRDEDCRGADEPEYDGLGHLIQKNAIRLAVGIAVVSLIITTCLWAYFKTRH